MYKLLPGIIIKLQEKHSTEKAKAELNNKIDPINFKITNVENRCNGNVVIQRENIVEGKKIKEDIENEISKEYEIKVPKQVEMQIITADINFKLPNKNILNKVKE